MRFYLNNIKNRFSKRKMMMLIYSSTNESTDKKIQPVLKKVVDLNYFSNFVFDKISYVSI